MKEMSIICKDISEYIELNKIEDNPKAKMMRVMDSGHRGRTFLPKASAIVCRKDIQLLDLSEDVSLDDIRKGKKETFQEYLFKYIDSNGLDEVQVYKDSNVDRKLFSKIRSDIDYKPSKKTCIALSFGLKMNIDDTLDLLEHAGHTLSYSIDFDLVIRYFKEHDITDINFCNEVLFNMNLELITN